MDEIEIGALEEAREKLIKAKGIVDEALTRILDAGLCDRTDIIWRTLGHLIRDIDKHLAKLKEGQP